MRHVIDRMAARAAPSPANKRPSRTEPYVEVGATTHIVKDTRVDTFTHTHSQLQHRVRLRHREGTEGREVSRSAVAL